MRAFGTKKHPSNKFRGMKNFLVLLLELLCRMDCFGRANFCASSTIGTYVRINHINISFGNSAHRTFVYASSASNTIFSNNVSHNTIK